MFLGTAPFAPKGGCKSTRRLSRFGFDMAKTKRYKPCDAAGFLSGNDDKGARLKALHTQSYGARLERQPPYM